MIAGEALTITPDLRKFGSLSCEINNAYGPTESHVVAAWHTTDKSEFWPEIPPIGNPISNCRIYIVDPVGLEPQPVGITGESR